MEDGELRLYVGTSTQGMQTSYIGHAVARNEHEARRAFLANRVALALQHPPESPLGIVNRVSLEGEIQITPVENVGSYVIRVERKNLTSGTPLGDGRFIEDGFGNTTKLPEPL